MRYLIGIVSVIILWLLSIGTYKSGVLPKELQEDINAFVIEFKHVVVHGSITEPKKKLGSMEWWQHQIGAEDESDID